MSILIKQDPIVDLRSWISSQVTGSSSTRAALLFLCPHARTLTTKTKQNAVVTAILKADLYFCICSMQDNNFHK